MAEPRDASRDDADVRASVRRFLLEQFLVGEDPTTLRDDTPLVTGGVLDSIGLLKLVTFLEERYGVAFDAHEHSPDHLDTVTGIVAVVQSKRATKR